MTKHLLGLCACLVAALVTSDRVAAQTIFDGPEVVFARPANVVDPLAGENTDVITGLVAFARSNNQGLFNAAAEASFGGRSSEAPSGTRWATGFNNPGALIDAANFANLTFESWSVAYGGSGLLGRNITTNDAVVHLIDEDIYLNLRFTEFGRGGAFSYVRSSAVLVPEPRAALLMLAALVAGLTRRRRVGLIAPR